MNFNPVNQPWTWLRTAGFLFGLALVTCRGGFTQENAENPARQVDAGDTPEAHLGAGYENLKNNRYEAAALLLGARCGDPPWLDEVSIRELPEGDRESR
jgi:hypothetical protein